MWQEDWPSLETSLLDGDSDNVSACDDGGGDECEHDDDLVTDRMLKDIKTLKLHFPTT